MSEKENQQMVVVSVYPPGVTDATSDKGVTHAASMVAVGELTNLEGIQEILVLSSYALDRALNVPPGTKPRAGYMVADDPAPDAA